MYANGYVGTSEDSQRIRKLDKQREEQRKKFEQLQDQKRNEAAGLRQFGASKSEAYEAVFKSETVGLVTREEFMQKRATIQERLEEDEARGRRGAEAAAAAERERQRREKEVKKAKAKLSFAADVCANAHAGSACGMQCVIVSAMPCLLCLPQPPPRYVLRATLRLSMLVCSSMTLCPP